MKPTKELYLAAADILEQQPHLARQEWCDKFNCFDIGGAILYVALKTTTEYSIYDRLWLLKPLDNATIFPNGWATGFNDMPEATPKLAAAKLREIAETIEDFSAQQADVPSLLELLTIHV